MKRQKRLNLTEKLIKGAKSKAARLALDSFKSYKRTMGLIDQVNIATGKKAIYNTTLNSTLDVRVFPHDLTATAEI